MKLSPAFDSLSDALKKVKCFGILKKTLLERKVFLDNLYCAQCITACFLLLYLGLRVALVLNAQD